MSAFGKGPIPANLENFGASTSQQAANATRRTSSGRRGGGRPYWADIYRPNESQIDTIRLIKGEHDTYRVDDNGELYLDKTPWLECVEHFHGSYQRGGLCSGGPYVFTDRTKRSPCHGCDIDWEAYNEQRATGSKIRSPISKSKKFVFTVVDMSLYHKVPQIDPVTGQYKLNPTNSQPYLDWDKCKGVGCPGCRSAAESQKGRVLPWPMSKAHFINLQSYGDSIGTCCLVCKGRGVISTLSWHCRNPQCGSMIFDLHNTTATIDEINSVVNKPYTCQVCGSTMYPIEQIHCANCSSRGVQPQRATIFDVDMQVKAVRTGNNEQTNLNVHATSDPKPLDPEFQGLLQYAPNLEKRFAPTPLDEQARMWHRQPLPQSQTHQPQYPTQRVNPQQYAQPYGAPAQQPQPMQQPPVQQPPVQQPVQQPFQQPIMQPGPVSFNPWPQKQ